MSEPASDIADRYWIQQQTSRKIDYHIHFNTTGETCILERQEKNSLEPVNIGFLALAQHFENFEVDSFINSPNLKQRVIFNVAADLVIHKVKYSNCGRPNMVNLLNIFITSGAGVGKSILMEI